MVFEAAMMALCVAALTAAHPGITLGRERWNDVGKFHWRRQTRRKTESPELERREAQVSSGGSSELEAVGLEGKA